MLADSRVDATLVRHLPTIGQTGKSAPRPDLIFWRLASIIGGPVGDGMEALMGVVTSEIDVAVDPKTAFRVASELEKFPDFMPDVEEVRVLERRDDGYARVAWVGHARLASIDKTVRWTEESWWDSESLTSRFEQVEGDYKHYRGDWAFTAVPAGTRIRLTVDFDLGLPLIGPMILRLLDNIMQKNIDSMLSAIKNEAEKGERRG